MLVGIMLAIMVLLTLVSIIFGGSFGGGFVDTTASGTTLIN